MLKGFLRFRKLEDVPLEPLEVIGQAIKHGPAKKYIAIYEKMLGPERLVKRKKSAIVPAA